MFDEMMGIKNPDTNPPTGADVVLEDQKGNTTPDTGLVADPPLQAVVTAPKVTLEAAETPVVGDVVVTAPSNVAPFVPQETNISLESPVSTLPQVEESLPSAPKPSRFSEVLRITRKGLAKTGNRLLGVATIAAATSLAPQPAEAGGLSPMATDAIVIGSQIFTGRQVVQKVYNPDGTVGIGVNMSQAIPAAQEMAYRQALKKPTEFTFDVSTKDFVAREKISFQEAEGSFYFFQKENPGGRLYLGSGGNKYTDINFVQVSPNVFKVSIKYLKRGTFDSATGALLVEYKPTEKSFKEVSAVTR